MTWPTDGDVPTSPTPRRRGRPRDPDADIRILESAARLILEHGFDATTVDAVAKHAGVGKATVYRRWAKKEDLAVAAMEMLYAQEMPVPDTGTLRGDLLESYRRVLEFVNSPAGAAYLRTTIAESVRDPRISALYRAAQERSEQGARAIFDRAAERGELRADAPLRWPLQWLGGLMATCVITGQQLPGVDDAEDLVDQVLRGIGA